jgi:hypothetical protein
VKILANSRRRKKCFISTLKQGLGRGPSRGAGLVPVTGLTDALGQEIEEEDLGQDPVNGEGPSRGKGVGDRGDFFI